MRARPAVVLAVLLAGRSSGSAAEPDLAAEPPAVSAVLTFEGYALDAEGVSHTSRYQERLVRQGGRLWIERLFPTGTAPARAADVHHIDTHVCARSIARTGADGVTVELVCSADKTVFTVRAESFVDLGFSPRWSVSAGLVDRGKLTLAVKPPAPPPAGARWYQASNADRYMRVLWSDRLDLPLLIETGLRNGRSWQRTTLEQRPMTAALPWQQLAGFDRRDLGDLGD